ncbi:MAG: 7-carboxy-7-deazaguanine synthase QueE [Bacteroidota bacterium]
MEKVKIKKNTTPKFAYGARDPLPVMEHFLTLQGEGNWTGTAAYFIRLAGCDVGCHWCDVKESWGVAAEQHMRVLDLIEIVIAHKAQHVVITGGEPTIYDLRPLVQSLHSLGIKVHLETAGVHPLLGDLDWVCFSPKKFKAPLDEYYTNAHELKVVIYNRHDLQWAESHASRCADHVKLFLQPEWDRREKMLPMIIAYIQNHPHWRLSQQTHKYMGIR